LPSYHFQSSVAAPQPAQQLAVGLSLTAPYPMAVQGALKLTFVASVFADDPSVQFASGGRTANFSIPANSTQALFNGNLAIPLQTGTTAGDIVITPAFAISGGFDVTPASPTVLTFTIPRAAPQVLAAGITSQTLNSFTIVLNGYSTTRGLQQLNIQITPKQGEKFSSTQLTVDTRSASAAWFQSAASQSTGGSFSLAVPFNLQNGSSTDDLVHRLQSLSISATNEAGQSNAVSLNIQ